MAGTWSWNRLWATWRIRSRGSPTRSNSSLEVVGVRLVAAGLLCGDDPVEADAEPRVRGGEQVVVAVGQDAEPEARLEPRQRGGGVGERRPIDHRAAERGELVIGRLDAVVAHVAASRRREDVAIAAVWRPFARRLEAGVGLEQLLAIGATPRGSRSAPKRRRAGRPPSRSACRSSRTSGRRTRPKSKASSVMASSCRIGQGRRWSPRRAGTAAIRRAGPRGPALVSSDLAAGSR